MIEYFQCLMKERQVMITEVGKAQVLVEGTQVLKWSEKMKSWLRRLCEMNESCEIGKVLIYAISKIELALKVEMPNLKKME